MGLWYHSNYLLCFCTVEFATQVKGTVGGAFNSRHTLSSLDGRPLLTHIHRMRAGLRRNHTVNMASRASAIRLNICRTCVNPGASHPQPAGYGDWTSEHCFRPPQRRMCYHRNDICRCSSAPASLQVRVRGAVLTRHCLNGRSVFCKCRYQIPSTYGGLGTVDAGDACREC